MVLMFVKRNANRSEKDDFTLNVSPALTNAMFEGAREAVEVLDEGGNLRGWNIQHLYE